MSVSPQTHGWEDFKPRETTDGGSGGRQLASYDEEIRLSARRRTAGSYEDWVFITLLGRSGIWTRICLDDRGTIHAQGFGDTRKEATVQMGRSLRARGIAAYRALDSDESEWR